jgi:hypothetical protein
MLTIFLWLVVLFCGQLAIRFSTSSWNNAIHKIVFWVITLMGLVLLLQQYGFIVRA